MRVTTRAAAVQLTETWIPCVQYSEARVQRPAVPEVTDSRASRREGRLSVDLTRPFRETSLSGSRYTMLCVDDCTCFKMICPLTCKSDTAAALSDIPDTHMTPLSLNIGTIFADGGAKPRGIVLVRPWGGGGNRHYRFQRLPMVTRHKTSILPGPLLRTVVEDSEEDLKESEHSPSEDEPGEQRMESEK